MVFTLPESPAFKPFLRFRGVAFAILYRFEMAFSSGNRICELFYHLKAESR